MNRENKNENKHGNEREREREGGDSRIQRLGQKQNLYASLSNKLDVCVRACVCSNIHLKWHVSIEVVSKFCNFLGYFDVLQLVKWCNDLSKIVNVNQNEHEFHINYRMSNWECYQFKSWTIVRLFWSEKLPLYCWKCMWIQFLFAATLGILVGYSDCCWCL